MAEIAETVTKQNLASTNEQAAQAAADRVQARADEGTPVKEETAPAPDEKAARAEARKAGLAELNKLAAQTKARFAETQAARAAREKYEAEMARMRDEHTKALAELDAAKKAPIPWLEKNGVKMRQVAEAIAKGEGPEDVLKELAARVTAAEEKLEAERKVWQEREEKARKAAEYERQKSEFLDAVEKSKEKLPYFMIATKGEPQRMIKAFMDVYAEVKANPDTAPFADQYSNEEILEAADARFREMGVALPAKAPPVSAAVSDKAKPAADPKPTLTTGAASAMDSAPPDFRKLSEKDQKRAMVELYRRMKSK